MSELSKALGMGPHITFEGVSYEIVPETYEMLAELQEYLEDRLRAKVRRLKGKIPEDQYIEQLDAMMRLLASEAMAPGTAEFDKALQTVEVRLQRMWRRLKEKNPDLEYALVKRLWDQHWREMELLAAQADSDPNPPRTATTDAACPG